MTRVERGPRAPLSARRRGHLGRLGLARTRENSLIRRERVQRIARRKSSARSTGRQIRLCLWHQYGSAAAHAGSRDRSASCAAPDRAARASTTRRTSPCSYSPISSRNARSSPAARGANHSARVARRLGGRRRSRVTPRTASIASSEQVIPPRLHLHEQAIERCHVDADRVVARSRAPGRASSRAGEGIEHAPATGTYRAAASRRAAG